VTFSDIGISVPPTVIDRHMTGAGWQGVLNLGPLVVVATRTSQTGASPRASQAMIATGVAIRPMRGTRRHPSLPSPTCAGHQAIERRQRPMPKW
jgi:hypothetical protein